MARVLAAAFLAGAWPAPAQKNPWEELKRPGQGTVTALEAHGSVLLAGLSDGQIHRSENGGRSWYRVSGPTAAPLNDFLSIGNVLLAGSGPLVDLGLWDCFTMDCPHPTEEGALLRSTDGGRTWKPTGITAVTALALHRANSVVYAATLKGILRSQDQGLTWTPTALAAATGEQGLRSSALVMDMLTLGSALHFHADAGLWEARLQPDGSLQTRRTVPDHINAAVLSGGGILAATLQGLIRVTGVGESKAVSSMRLAAFGGNAPPLIGASAAGEVWRSADDGRTWTAAGRLPAWESGRAPAHRFWALQDTLLAGTSGKGVYRLNPLSEAWTPMGEGLTQDPVAWLAFARGGTPVINDPGMGLAYWNFPPSGGWMPIREKVWRAAANEDGVFTADSQIGFATPGAPPWRKLADYPFACQGIVAGKGWAVAVRSDNVLTLCEAAGPCRDLPGERLPKPYFMSPVSFSARNAFHAGWASGDSLYLALDSLYVSANRGQTLAVVAPVPSGALRLTGARGRLWLASGSVVRAYGPKVPSGLFTSDDGGRTWFPDHGAGAKTIRAWDVAVDPSGTAYMATDSGLYARKEGEAAWTDFGRGLARPGMRSVAVSKEALLVGMAEGPVMRTWLEGTAVRGAGRHGRTAFRRAAAPSPRSFQDARGGLRRLDGRTAP